MPEEEDPAVVKVKDSSKAKIAGIKRKRGKTPNDRKLDVLVHKSKVT
jgi:hypothetical protein